MCFQNMPINSLGDNEAVRVKSQSTKSEGARVIDPHESVRTHAQLDQLYF